jgi:hypothetical protein
MARTRWLAGGIPIRIHQEDGCQATATPPGLKYKEQGGPTLRDLAVGKCGRARQELLHPAVIQEQAERISRG